MFLRDLEDLINQECLVNFDCDDTSVWTDDNTVKCKITGFQYEIDDSYPSRIIVLASVTPIEEHKNLDDDTINELGWGVSLDDIINITEPTYLRDVWY